MAKQQRKNRRGKRTRRRWHLSTPMERHVRAFARAEGATPSEVDALVAAMPPPARYHTSHWLEGAIERMERSAGCSRSEATALLARLQRWAHRVGRLPQHHMALQLANLELARRRGGEEPRPIDLPPPVRPGELEERELRRLVAQWEALGYAQALASVEDTEADHAGLLSALIMTFDHLADADGVPMRLERLDTAAFALFLENREREDPAAPEKLAVVILGLAAEVYARVVERGWVEPDIGTQLAEELHALCLAYSGASHAA